MATLGSQQCVPSNLPTRSPCTGIVTSYGKQAAHRTSTSQKRRSSRCCSSARHAIETKAVFQGPSTHQPMSSSRSNGSTRRGLLTVGLFGTAFTFSSLWAPFAACADDFTQTLSGLRFLDVREGDGATPQPGDTVEIHWAGYTKGYQGKRIDNTSVRDEPYSFKLGSHEAIPAVEEAVSTMKTGGVRRVEVPGEKPELGYPIDRSQRFTDEFIDNGKLYRYRYGPQPKELSGQRALDFVLDNPTLQDFNRTLLIDIKLLAVRKARG